MRGMDAGSAADWAAAIFTGGALLAAVYQLREGRREAERGRQREYAAEADRREAMARAVGVTVQWLPDQDYQVPPDSNGLMPVETVVLNAGPYPISGAVLELQSDGIGKQIVYGTILPGQQIDGRHEVHRREVVFGELLSGATLLFTDTYGNHWARSTDWLERRADPARTC